MFNIFGARLAQLAQGAARRFTGFAMRHILVVFSILLFSAITFGAQFGLWERSAAFLGQTQSVVAEQWARIRGAEKDIAHLQNVEVETGADKTVTNSSNRNESVLVRINDTAAKSRGEDENELPEESAFRKLKEDLRTRWSEKKSAAEKLEPDVNKIKDFDEKLQENVDLWDEYKAEFQTDQLIRALKPKSGPEATIDAIGSTWARLEQAIRTTSNDEEFYAKLPTYRADARLLLPHVDFAEDSQNGSSAALTAVDNTLRDANNIRSPRLLKGDVRDLLKRIGVLGDFDRLRLKTDSSFSFSRLVTKDIDLSNSTPSWSACSSLDSILMEISRRQKTDWHSYSKSRLNAYRSCIQDLEKYYASSDDQTVSYDNEAIAKLQKAVTEVISQDYEDLVKAFKDATEDLRAQLEMLKEDEAELYALLNVEFETIETLLSDRRDAKEAENLLLQVLIAWGGLIAIVALTIYFIARSHRGVSRQFEYAIFLEIITVFILSASILILGITKNLEQDTVAALLGGISGYVLGRMSMERQMGGAGKSSGGVEALSPVDMEIKG